ncbi:MAG TPA: hypothetical protein VFD58_21900 [Blastocatellia bacterium]|nr:hypothetical protein [Blastocatellia bacterium]
MKRVLLLLLAALAMAGLQSSRLTTAQAVARFAVNDISTLTPSLAASPQSREFRKTVAFEPGGELTFGTDKGSVKLTSWDRHEIEIYARIEPPEHTDSEYGRRAVEAAKIDVFGDARALTVRSNFDDVPNRDDRWGNSKSLPDIHYEIRAPRNLNLRLSADRSNVRMQGFEGRLRLHTDRTGMEASELAGEIQIKMDRGKADLSALRGGLDLETDRTDSQVHDLRIEKDSRLDISRGEAELRLPGSQGLTVSADTGRRESFQTDFEIATRTFGGGKIEGNINGGGPKLSIHGDRMRVHLKRQ